MKAKQKHEKYLRAKHAGDIYNTQIIRRETRVPIRSAVNTGWLDTNLMRDTYI